MYTCKIVCLVLIMSSVSLIGFGGVHIPRMNTVVTNDFSASEFNSYFTTVETTTTNLVLTFKGNVNSLYYRISDVDDVNECRGGQKISLRVDQTLWVGDGRHVSLVVKGCADETSAGFELVKAFDGRAFGRGVAVFYGRLLLQSKSRKIREGDIVIVGAKEMNMRVGGLCADPIKIGKIRHFIMELIEAYNEKDVKRLKLLSGGAYDRLLRWMDAGELLGGVEVLSCHERDVITACVEITLLGSGDDPYTFTSNIELTENNGTYYIKGISLFDRWNRSLDSAIEASEMLIKAINRRDLTAVKDLLYGGEGRDLGELLLERGLMWIKDAVDRRVKIPQCRMVVRCAQGRRMEGEVLVPCDIGGTNIVRKVVFAGAKIKCADGVERRDAEMGFAEWLKRNIDKKGMP